MDEDQPATQPHLAPAEQAAQEEARMRTADDSFVSGSQPTETAAAVTPAPVLGTAKKVTISPVSDMSGFSSAPNIPVAPPQPQPVVQTTITPQESTGSSVSGVQYAQPTVTTQQLRPSPIVSAPTYGSTQVNTPNTKGEARLVGMKYNSRAASDLPFLQYFAIGLVLYGCYNVYNYIQIMALIKAKPLLLAAIMLFGSSYALIYGIYYLIARSLRNVSGALLSQILMQTQILLISLPLWGGSSWSLIASSQMSAKAVVGYLIPIAIVIVAFVVRQQVHALDDAPVRD